MASTLSSFLYLLLVMISSFSMLIQPGLSRYTSSTDVTEFYSLQQCWAAMEDMMVCGYEISEILGGNLMSLNVVSEECCKAINEVTNKCAFYGLNNPFNFLVPPFVKDLCYNNNGNGVLSTPSPFVVDPYGPLN
ncbi:hypothetical protein A4A49_33537 [Nicotiana attenuata]|uniref:Prolamin-like domain-containing protein n=1 Tax=Nicotiana attenuata TaxID=49451 RepID=A0A1J6HWA9_NICAT|nr:hypothetical protein A4A49_33537 [Nicotiana attenuata]